MSSSTPISFARRRFLLSLLVLVPLSLISAVTAASARAEGRGPAWSLQVLSQPTVLSAADNANPRCDEPLNVIGSCDRYTVVLTNVGTLASSGPVVMTDLLPQGVTTSKSPQGVGWSCITKAGSRETVICETENSVAALTATEAIQIPVTVPATEGMVENEAIVTGGGGVPARVLVQTQITSPLEAAPPQPFGPLGFSFSRLGQAGAPYTQAAGHPGALVSSFYFPSTASLHAFRKAQGDQAPIAPFPDPEENVRDVVTDLPPGVIGDALASPKCSLAGALSIAVGGCPPSTRIGTLALFQGHELVESALAIYNVVPEDGHAAEFGIYYPRLGRTVFLYASVVGTGAETHVRVTGLNSDVLEIEGVSLTFFGTPAVIDETPLSPAAFATNPSDCSAPGFTTTIYVDTWQHPGRTELNGEPDLTDPNWKKAQSTSAPVSGCELLRFEPTFAVRPTTSQPDSPTGVSADLQVPQNDDPNGLSTPPLKDLMVTLPQGMVLSPSAANGLQACTDQQFDLSSNTPASCPQASQVATLTLHTPLLEEPLAGEIFLATPECDPCGNQDAQSGKLARALIQLQSERYGITVKLPGDATVDPSTGQITLTTQSAPEQPFDDLKVSFPEGPRAVVSTPNACGEYVTTSDLTPWSAPQTHDATPASSFKVAGCGPDAFTPSFSAGTTNPQSAAYSPFTLTFSRQDGEQSFSGLEQTLPPGLLAKLAGVQQCGDAEANRGACPVGSRLGTVTVGAGPGREPFYTTGTAYLTGPYNGGPFGVAVVVQAVAGPFNLGTVVVRNSIRVNPTTAQATVVSDPFPTMLAGIPLQIRTINVTLDRSEFTFNPTNCNPLAITGKLVSTAGGSFSLSSPYEATNCANLPFKPSFTASAQGNGETRGHGASLDVKIATHQGPDVPAAEREADIQKVDVSLPYALSPRLKVLQKACTAAQFAANPADCPPGSFVGSAVAHTPLLNVPLEGPAILVSHASEAFPDLEIVLQGEGIEVALDGHTKITKGITYSKFETVPDAPFSSFELKLPEGREALLGAIKNPCKPTKTVTTKKKVTVHRNGRTSTVTKKVKTLVPEPLIMPTSITGQNGAVLTQSTKISATGCPKAKQAIAARRGK